METRHKGAITWLTAAAVVVLAIGAAGWWRMHFARENPPDGFVVAEIGLSAQNMALASLDGGDALALFEAMGELQGGIASVDAARTGLDATVHALSEARRVLLREPGNSEAAAAVQALETQIVQDRQNYRAACEELRENVLAILDDEAAQALEEAIHAKAVAIPPQCRVLTYTDEEMLELEAAWSAVQRAQRLADEPPPDTVAIVNAAISHPAAVAAEVALEQNFVSVNAAFDMLD